MLKFFSFFVVFSWWIPAHAEELFDEMCVKQSV
jgi:hypothetical protein